MLCRWAVQTRLKHHNSRLFPYTHTFTLQRHHYCHWSLILLLQTFMRTFHTHHLRIHTGKRLFELRRQIKQRWAQFLLKEVVSAKYDFRQADLLKQSSLSIATGTKKIMEKKKSSVASYHLTHDMMSNSASGWLCQGDFQKEWTDQKSEGVADETTNLEKIVKILSWRSALEKPPSSTTHFSSGKYINYSLYHCLNQR